MKGFVASLVILLTLREIASEESDYFKALEEANRVRWFESVADGWNLVFSAKSGRGKLILDAWLAADDIPASNDNADLFKSPLAEAAADKPFDQIKIQLLNECEIKDYYIFDGKGADKTNFMSAERLTTSAHGDFSNATFNFFAVNGDPRYGRSFYINRNYGGCDVDAGWLVVSDAAENTPCDWMDKAPRPYFMYCNGTAPCLTNDALIADTFQILVKYAD